MRNPQLAPAPAPPGLGRILVFDGRRESYEELEHALMIANGGCGGAPCLVAKLLLPEAGLVGLDLRALDELVRLDDEDQAGVPCFTLAGRMLLPFPPFARGGPDSVSATFWISRDDFLLRRVETRKEVIARGERTGIEDAITFEPERYVPLAGEAFAVSALDEL